MSQQTHFNLFTQDASGNYAEATGDAIVSAARKHLNKMIKRGNVMDSPSLMKDFLAMRLGQLQHEVFTVLFLNAQMALIECLDMFRGSLTQTSVYPREVVKEALRLNAASVVLSHCHPSGVAEPSRADEYLTQTLKTALALVDVRVIDHVIVAGGSTLSFAERGLL